MRIFYFFFNFELPLWTIIQIISGLRCAFRDGAITSRLKVYFTKDFWLIAATAQQLNEQFFQLWGSGFFFLPSCIASIIPGPVSRQEITSEFGILGSGEVDFLNRIVILLHKWFIIKNKYIENELKTYQQIYEDLSSEEISSESVTKYELPRSITLNLQQTLPAELLLLRQEAGGQEIEWTEGVGAGSPDSNRTANWNKFKLCNASKREDPNPPSRGLLITLECIASYLFKVEWRPAERRAGGPLGGGASLKGPSHHLQQLNADTFTSALQLGFNWNWKSLGCNSLRSPL